MPGDFFVCHLLFLKIVYFTELGGPNSLEDQMPTSTTSGSYFDQS